MSSKPHCGGLFINLLDFANPSGRIGLAAVEHLTELSDL